MASRVWDSVMTALGMQEGQKAYGVLLCVFSSVHSVYSVVIQSTLSWKQKMEDSTSLRGIQGERRTEAELKVMSNTPKILPSASYLRVVMTEVLAPCYLDGVSLPCTAPLLSLHTHCEPKSSWGLLPDQANAQWTAEEANSIHSSCREKKRKSKPEKTQAKMPPKYYFLQG